MSLLDRFRPKWKHPDPAVREAAVAGLDDPAVLEAIAENDGSESVRRAAVQALTDQDALARIAAGSTPLAVPAMTRLHEPSLISIVAQSAAQYVVREMAVERIDDGVMLHRISTSDTDARVRLKARTRRNGPDPVRDFIRAELSKLRTATSHDAPTDSFRGSLDVVAGRLIGDPRFRINGWLAHEIPGLAMIRELPGTGQNSPARTDKDAPESDVTCARFVAFKRGDSGNPEENSTSQIHFDITVWRTGADTFLSAVEERSLKLIADAAEWSRVSNSTHNSAQLTTKSTPKQGEQ